LTACTGAFKVNFVATALKAPAAPATNAINIPTKSRTITAGLVTATFPPIIIKKNDAFEQRRQ
jgi:hypothetical protein